MKFRYYDPKKDLPAITRIWQEAGWIEKDEQEEKALSHAVEGGKVLVADIRKEAECMVQTLEGSIRYGREDLPLSVLAAVLTSLVGRKEGLAGKLTATAIAEAVESGAALAGLGMFEQGFYNRLGFGTGTYEKYIAFDPSTLNVPTKTKAPFRIAKEEWQKVHEKRLKRYRVHGSCNIFDPSFTRFDMEIKKEGFGLGFYDEKGDISHHFFGKKKGEYGPLKIYWMNFRSYPQLLELLSLIKSFSDQVCLVEMVEPAGVQLQDLLVKPFRYRRITEKSDFQSSMDAVAFWQMRVCDLKRCVEALTLKNGALSFHLTLTDPIESFLTGRDGWKGVAGEYTVHLGESSSVEAGRKGELPHLRASVNSFTRLWLGVLSARVLSVFGDLKGPAELIDEIDEALLLPQPHTDWLF
jgi:predicted acetyltransferase